MIKTKTTRPQRRWGRADPYFHESLPPPPEPGRVRSPRRWNAEYHAPEVAGLAEGVESEAEPLEGTSERKTSFSVKKFWIVWVVRQRSCFDLPRMVSLHQYAFCWYKDSSYVFWLHRNEWNLYQGVCCWVFFFFSHNSHCSWQKTLDLYVMENFKCS